MRNLFKGIALTCFILTCSLITRAARVDTVETYSDVMKKKIKAVVISPANYDNLKAMPVVYLLHGFGADYKNWISFAPHLKDIADADNLMIVCADGNVRSWYFDAPENPKSKYETYISTELVKYVDEHYKTIKNRTGRAITGLSMGGHGALYVSFKHQDVYGAAGSTSGGVDIRPFPNNWDMSQLLGTYADKPENWEKNTVINMLHLLTPKKLSLIIDCGTEDFFYKVNCNLHDELLYRNIPHDFITRPGGHDSRYWANSIKYQLQFFHDYFVANNK
ncbi:alpha/beta hydrolase [Mucilaginibacter myungsuensis]|uniref:Esterase family protein n=1 Tax=Mucilaginibacter myungsuensis TaxID=649104 RepID=A0A929L0C9_9SPHI|nr:alpha/beta hydrolase family protein [Mucilaginibacter myungsuensis]MBE9662174.1 esterase family protein [Mucilaginibacter myungsuensis]MDN3599392.1 alpha/beta hydrolase family protein [Mucilaginibacter myungsuensis]